MLHGQKVREAPRKLLCAIQAGCGTAPTLIFVADRQAFTTLHRQKPRLSCWRKMRYASGTRAQVFATSNPGCLLQMRAAEIHHTNQQVLHVIELLEQANTG